MGAYACIPGYRAGFEKAVTTIMPILCGAVGIGTVGHLENAMTFSPLQLVIDNEVAAYVRRAIQGFAVTDETIDVDLIKRVGIGGQYLAEMETAMQFRDIMHLSPFFKVEGWGPGQRADENRRWEKLAAEKARKLINTETEPVLTPDQVKEIDKVVEEAEAKLAEN